MTIDSVLGWMDGHEGKSDGKKKTKINEIIAAINALVFASIDDLKEAEMVGSANAQYVVTFPHANPSNTGGATNISLASMGAPFEPIRNVTGNSTDYYINVGIPLIKVIDGTTYYLHIAGAKAYVNDADEFNYVDDLQIWGWTSGGVAQCGSTQTLTWNSTGLKETTWTGIKCGDKDAIIIWFDMNFNAANAWGSSPFYLKVYYAE